MTAAKHVLPVVILLGAIGGVAALVSWGPRKSGTVRVFDCDIGIVGDQDNSVCLWIPIVNTGRKPVTIAGVSACCGTSLPRGFPKRVDAQSVASLFARVNPPLVDGTFSRTIKIFVNDLNCEPLAVTISGTRENMVKVSPRRVYLGNVRRGSRVPRCAELQLADNEVKQVAVSADFVKASVAKTDGTVELSVSIGDSAPVGPLREWVFMTTKSGAPAYTAIELVGVVEGQLRPEPTVLLFGKADSEGRVLRTLRLINTEAEKRSSCRIEYCPSWLDVDLGEGESGDWELDASVKDGALQSGVKDRLRVALAEGDVLDIPVIAVP